MRDAWRTAAVLLCAAIAAGAAAEAAGAGIATGRPAKFMAAADERNALTVDRTSSGEVQFRDAVAPIVAGLFCLPIPLGQALCDPDGDPRDLDGGGVSVDLGDRDDRAIVLAIPRSDGKGATPGSIAVLGGPGKDYLENTASAFIRFDGGAGDDTLVAGAANAGPLIGGTGADVTASTTLCCATSYEDHDRGVRVTLDGKPNDGAPDELDDVETPAVIGGPGPDVITGDGAANSLTGGAGADVLDGGAGGDRIDATLAFATDGADTITCGTGIDDVLAEPNDKIAVDCEEARVGGAAGPKLALAPAAVRASRSGLVTFTYRSAGNANTAAASLGSVRLVDRKGRAASSRAQVTFAAGATVARVRTRLSRPTRVRLARSRAGRLALFAQRTYRGDAVPPGYALFNAPLTVRRAR